jgi:RNA polymerase-binding transcription factor DksA
MKPDEIEEARRKLIEMRTQWDRRLAAIRSDRRREGGFEKDWDEQAIQRENDEVLDGLDETGRRELEGIEAALARLDAGTYGRCARCDETIPPARLAAAPAAATCADCAAA